MSYPFNYPTPKNANIQIFSAPNFTNVVPQQSKVSWVKPQGASFVWFTLIGAGGAGDITSGGGSGAVTNCMVPAFLIPDELNVSVGKGGYPGAADGTLTGIYYSAKGSYYLLTANGGLGSGSYTGGTASTSNYFSCIGFFQSIDGQAGSVGAVSASATTFLTGGGQAGGVTANYGYSYPSNGTGFFQMQPIIVGLGSTSNSSKSAGYGCGGALAASSNTFGGDGLCVIITW